MVSVWFIYAILASLLWGLTYVFAGRLLQLGVSPSLVLCIESILIAPVFLLIGLKQGNIKPGLDLIFSEISVFWPAVLLVLCSTIGNYFIVMSIAEKNATMAAFIEISYPIFTALFGWLLFRNSQLNIGTALGGLLIFCGIGLIYFKGNKGH